MCFPPQRCALFSKSGPSMVCFVHFDFEMCFAPQQCALFRRLNFQSWSEREVFNFFTCKCASRHNGVHFFNISTSKSRPRPSVFNTYKTSNFSSLIWTNGSAPAALASLLFDPPEPQTIRKNTVNRDFSTFSRACIFFPLTLSSDSFLWLFPLTLSLLFLFSDLLSSSLLFSLFFFSLLLSSSLLFSSLLFSSLLFSCQLVFSSLVWLFPPLLFHLSILSEVWLLNFLWVVISL